MLIQQIFCIGLLMCSSTTWAMRTQQMKRSQPVVSNRTKEDHNVALQAKIEQARLLNCMIKKPYLCGLPACTYRCPADYALKKEASDHNNTITHPHHAEW